MTFLWTQCYPCVERGSSFKNKHIAVESDHQSDIPWSFDSRESSARPIFNLLYFSTLAIPSNLLFQFFFHKQEARRRPLAAKLTGKAVLAAAATDSAGCHRDSILSLASVKLNQRLLISSSRDGAIKVWK